MKPIHIALLPEFAEPESLSTSGAVVIDVLRASTTIIAALSRGAVAVIPCLTPEDATATADRAAAGSVLKGGERHGRLIPGFDLDNSPFSYSPEVVRGKQIAFTTTNGTKALLACRNAQEVIVGAFVNRAAVVRRITADYDSLVLMCAGTDGRFTPEDILFAGAVAHDLVASDSGWEPAGVQAQMTLDYFRARSRDRETFQAAFLAGRGAQNLFELGYHRDLELAQQDDLFTTVPRFEPTTGIIQLLK